MEDCIFCKIASGTIPCDRVYQDEEVLVFKDISPQAPVHLLGIPKKHIATLNDLSEKDADITVQLLLRLKAIAKEMPQLKNGYRVVINCGRESGQAVFHLHFHLLGGRVMTWPPG